jgi:hypothetical protein
MASVRPKLDVRAGPEIAGRREQLAGVQCGHRLAAQRVGEHADGLGQMR